MQQLLQISLALFLLLPCGECFPYNYLLHVFYHCCCIKNDLFCYNVLDNNYNCQANSKYIMVAKIFSSVLIVDYSVLKANMQLNTLWQSK